MAADAFLMTSRVDPFLYVCQEAMACRLPIIAFREGGGTIEMIGSEAGFMVPNFSVPLMVDRLIEVARDDKLRRQLGNRGAELIEENWQPEEYCDLLLR